MTALVAKEIWKSFGGTAALKGMSLNIEAGSIHALVGENGAGKSTLIKVVTGVHEADRGAVEINGIAQQFRSVHDAIAAGISAVFQERNLVPQFSIAENLFLHEQPRRAGFIHYRRMEREAKIWLDRIGVDLPPHRLAGELSVGQSQLVEIARGLALQAKVLLLDEPTASLTDRDAEGLFAMLTDLRSRGTATVFVSHKLDEVFAISDRITVIRDGRTIVDAADRSELTRTDVITAMVGRTISFASHNGTASGPPGTPALAVEALSTPFGHRDVSFALPRGQVVGLYGLVGAGRTELARAILGLNEVDSGRILVDGEVARIKTPNHALRRYRIGYVSEDRKGEGLILSYSASHNMGITIWDRLSSTLGYISLERERREVALLVRQLGVKLAGLDQPAGELSGGNQQKISVGKWLAGDVDILIIDEPTIGVDVRTKEDMYELIEGMARAGKAILVISSDLAEIIRIADRILVMADKRIVTHLENNGTYESLSTKIMSSVVAAERSRTSLLE